MSPVNTESDGTGNVRKPDADQPTKSNPTTRESGSGGGAETGNPTTRPRGGGGKKKGEWR